MLDITRYIRPGDTVMWSNGTAEPTSLTEMLVSARESLREIRIICIVPFSTHFTSDVATYFHFIGIGGYGFLEALERERRLEILPVRYSDLPRLLRAGALKVDVALVQVSPRGKDDCHTFGAAADYTRTLVDTARYVLAEVNSQAPVTSGDTLVLPSSFTDHVEVSRPLLEYRVPQPDSVDLAIAENVARLIPYGATLEVGIGSLGEAVWRALSRKQDLGVHSGILTDAIADLMEAGVITNRQKAVDEGLTVGGVLFGTRRLYEFAHRNPRISLRAIDYTHDPCIMSRLECFFSINFALEVDLTGQVNAEVADGLHFGAVGGLPDFAEGAHRSHGGASIIALRSTTKRGRVSRIVAHLNKGVVTLPRTSVDYVVTEFGIAELRGRSLQERVRAMVSIAHPNFRGRLSREASAVA
jgi:acyl-CoA hydrolase